MLGKRLQLEENQEYLHENVTNLLLGPKLSALLISKNLKYDSGTTFRHSACFMCDLFPQCYLKNGGRGGAIVIPMYYLESCASQSID